MAQPAVLTRQPDGSLVLRSPYEARFAIREIPGIVWQKNQRYYSLAGPDATAPVYRSLQDAGFTMQQIGAWPPETPTPAPMRPDVAARFPLREYQRDAVEAALGNSALLAALDMGLGKSLVALAIGAQTGGPVLVIGPAISRSVWAGTAFAPGEIRKWLGADADVRILEKRKDIDSAALDNLTPNTWVFGNYEILDYHNRKIVDLDTGALEKDRVSLLSSVIPGSMLQFYYALAVKHKRNVYRLINTFTSFEIAAARRTALNEMLDSGEVSIANLLDNEEWAKIQGKEALVPSAWLELLCRVEWKLIVADEIHNIKNRKSKRAAALSAIGDAFPQAKRLGLTGTPIHNHPRDLWKIIDWLFPGRLGDYWSFAKRYADAHEGDFGWSDSGVSHGPELQYRLGWFMVRKTKQELKDLLPPKVRQVIALAPSPEDAQALDRAVGVLYQERALEGKKPTHGEVQEVIAQFGLAKADALLELLESRSSRVVVFVYRKETAHAIHEKLLAATIPAFLIHGDIDQPKRLVQIHGWQQVENAVLVTTIGVAQASIDLSAASTAVFLDIDPVPGVLLQCEDRLWRPPQTFSVSVYYISLRGTVDEAMARKVVGKLDAYVQIMGAEVEARKLAGDIEQIAALSGDDVIDALAGLLAEQEKF